MPEKLRYLGLANDWADTPQEVRDCKHNREQRLINRTLRETTCKKCKFYYRFDLKRHVEHTWG